MPVVLHSSILQFFFTWASPSGTHMRSGDTLRYSFSVSIASQSPTDSGSIHAPVTSAKREATAGSRWCPSSICSELSLAGALWVLRRKSW